MSGFTIAVAACVNGEQRAALTVQVRQCPVDKINRPLQERRPRGGRQATAPIIALALPGDLTRQSSVAPSMTDRPDMKIETDRDRDLFQKSDRDRSTLEKVRS